MRLIYQIPGSIYVGVTVWFGWGVVVCCGILMQAEALLICSCGMCELGVNFGLY